MRYAVISDVHANLEALEAVCARLAGERVDRVICLGDTVGYHANPNECVARIRDRCDVVIAGNHDRAAVGTLDSTDFPFVARRAIGWTQRVIEAEHVAYLAKLPVFATLDAATCMVHAALAPEPNDLFHVSTPARIAANLGELARRSERLCWFGHTHRPAVHALRDGRVSSLPADGTVTIAPDTHYLVNPGSVGQSRDADPRAAFAVFDTDRQTIAFLRVEFDLIASRRTAEAAGLLASPNVVRRSFEAARSRWLDARVLARRVRTSRRP